MKSEKKIVENIQEICEHRWYLSNTFRENFLKQTQFKEPAAEVVSDTPEVRESNLTRSIFMPKIEAKG